MFIGKKLQRKHAILKNSPQKDLIGSIIGSTLLANAATQETGDNTGSILSANATV
jgi:hypothetical protein